VNWASINLLNASIVGDLERVQHLLEKEGADVEVRGDHPDGYVFLASPLIMAAYEGHQEVVEYLSKTALADVDAGTRRGFTALHEASFGGFQQVVVFLVEGAKAAVDAQCEWDGSTPLLSAASSGHLEVFRYLHRNASANLELPTEDGITPLLQAAWKKHFAVAKYCIDSGANCAAHTEQGLTLYDYARRSGNQTFIDFAQKLSTPWYVILKLTFTRFKTWITIVSSIVAAFLFSYFGTRAESRGSSDSAQLAVPRGARLLACRTVMREDTWHSVDTSGAQLLRALELIANVVYPCGVCMMLVEPWLAFAFFLAVYLIPALFTHGAGIIFKNPVLGATVTGQKQRIFALIRTFLLYPGARMVCSGGTQWHEWFTVNDIKCSGYFANDKARWFVDPEWDVWEGRVTEVPFVSWHISSKVVFHNCFMHGVIYATMVWAFLIAIQILMTLAGLSCEKSSAVNRDRLRRINRLAEDIHAAGDWDEVSKIEIDKDGDDIVDYKVQPVVALRWGFPPSGILAKLSVSFVDLFVFDLLQTVLLLQTKDYMFAGLMLWISCMSVMSQARAIGGWSAFRAEIDMSLQAGVMTDKLLDYFDRERGAEAFLSLGLFSYAFPFVGRTAVGLINSMFSMTISIFTISTYTYEQLDILLAEKDEEDENGLLDISQSGSETD